MKVSLTSKVNKKYRRIALSIFFSLLVFVIAPLLIPQEKEAEGTNLGSAIDNGDSYIYLSKATYYEENHLLEVAFLSQGKDISSQGLSVSAVAMNEKNKKYPIKQEKINDNYVVLFITDVPNDFKQVKITLTDSGRSSDMFSATLDPIFITSKNSKTESMFVAQTTQTYQKNYLDGLIGIQEKHLQTIDDEIEKLNKQISDLEKSSSDVTANVELMTGTEKQKAMDKIKQNTSQIAQIETQIKAKEEEKTEYNEKIARVKEAQ